ncbi:Spx/MgsR family RNA polymerase-binding regulatory protein [Limosilactobacillus caecicola]|uniref:Spx/MgsR family RNA polymerase-binding regulatory protein n=1 Tax=Limosilactobacillus caecicola TaxID=2941332 RepID=UPI00203E9488|nr:Spx/MgsR family RNA polymerase-binding regulatory protein [Limosilactobacillus caecicola]
MITVYTAANSSSCRKALNWFRNHQIIVTEHKLYTIGITQKELEQMLTLSEKGTEEFISTRSNIYKRMQIDFNKLSFDEFTEIVCANPRLLRAPIIMSKYQIQIGFNSDSIRSFIPKAERDQEMDEALAAMY